MLQIYDIVCFPFLPKKINAVIEPSAGHFRRLIGFKTKDSSYDAKAKDFKNFFLDLRQLVHPRGLHFCYTAKLCHVIKQIISVMCNFFFWAIF